MTLAAEASDSDGTVGKVNFWADGALVGSDTTPPYSVTYREGVENTRNFWVTAEDNFGARRELGGGHR